MSPFRDPLAMLRARHAELTAELQRIDDEKQRARRLAEGEAELRAERGRLARALEGAPATRELPLLSSIRIASPCGVSWNEMIGDERTRHCGSCRREVFNLAALTPDEAERFLEERLGEDLCVRLYRRRDRTVLVGGDCRTGAARRTAAIAASGLTLVVAGLALFVVRGSARVECDDATGSDVTRAGVVSRGVTGAVCEPPVRPTAPIELMGALWVEDIEESVGLPQLGEPLTQPDRPTGLYVEGAPRLPVARPHRNARASDDRGGTGGRWVVWLDSQSRDRSSVRRTSHLEPARRARGWVFSSQRVEVARRRRVVLAHIARATLARRRPIDQPRARPGSRAASLTFEPALRALSTSKVQPMERGGFSPRPQFSRRNRRRCPRRAARRVMTSRECRWMLRPSPAFDRSSGGRPASSRRSCARRRASASRGASATFGGV